MTASDLGFPICCYCGRVRLERDNAPWAVDEVSYFVCTRPECEAKMRRNEPYRFEAFARVVEVGDQA